MALPRQLQGKLSVPVIGSPLFIVSNPNLVVEQCKAGIVGSFPALNARPEGVFEDWVKEIKDRLGEEAENNPGKKIAPFAVNQICHASNPRLMTDMEICVKHEVPVIITSLRPPAEVVEAAHSYGGLVFHDVINQRHARKAAEQGVDGLILVASGAGGHAGTINPFALVREIKEWFDGTVILSGSIADGHGVAGALALGADLAYIGTRFVASAEANAVDAYKDMIVESGSEDIVYSNLFSGVHGNYLKGSVRNQGMDPDNLPEGDLKTMNFGSGGNTKAKAWKDIWGSGQGIGTVTKSAPVEETVARLEREYIAAKEALAKATA